MKEFKVGQYYYIPRSLGIIPLANLEGKIFVDKMICSSIKTLSNGKTFIESENSGSVDSRCFNNLDQVKEYAMKLSQLEIKRLEGQIASIKQQIESISSLNFIVVDDLKEK